MNQTTKKNNKTTKIIYIMSDENYKANLIESAISTLQDGAMTYYHLFDTVNRNDRYNIGSLVLTAAKAVENLIDDDNDNDDNDEAVEIIGDIEDWLCELDSYDPHKEPDDCKQVEIFNHIFDLISRLKWVLGVVDY